MLNNFIIKRKDINSNKVFSKDKLFRLVIIDSKLIYDRNDNLKGRGIYLLKNKESILNAFDKNRLLKKCNKESLDKTKEELLNEIM